MKKIVVVGGGFAGLNLIKALAEDKRFQITLVDKNNYHFFPPLLYQVSAAFIEPSNICYPFRRMFQGKENLRYFQGSLLQVRPDEKVIETDHGTLPYDYLVLALGTESNFFGLESVRENSLPMKTIDEALNMRNHLLQNLEMATRTSDRAERESLLNIVIAGGGPTGVELAGMLAELGQNIAAKEYPEITDPVNHIYLVDAGPELLAPMSKKAQTEAKAVLQSLGVHVILNTAVREYSDGKVLLGDGQTIATNTLIWASGVIAREVPGLPKETVGRGRRILVDEFNRVKGSSDIFAIGDLCLQTTDMLFPNGHPQQAQVAIQQGSLLARNLQHLQSGKALKPFRYNDKGSMAIICKYKAIADLPKFSFKGFLAWVIWLVIHLIPLAGFRNKARLAFSWLWSFITNDPTLRLMIRPKIKEKTS